MEASSAWETMVLPFSINSTAGCFPWFETTTQTLAVLGDAVAELKELFYKQEHITLPFPPKYLLLQHQV